MPALKIKVGAALDADALAVFQPIERAAERARKNVAASLNAGAKQTKDTAKSSADAQVKENERAAKEMIRAMKAADRMRDQAIRAGEREASQLAKTQEKAEKQRINEVAKSARERVRLEREAMREVERMLADDNRARAKAQREAAANEKRIKREGFFTGGKIGVGRRAAIGMRGLGGAGAAAAYGLGTQLAGDVLGGIGVNTSFQSMISTGVENQSLATKVVNSGYIPGAEGSSGKLQSASGVLAEVQQAATNTAFATQDMLHGLESFVAKTGDLDTGRALLERMGRLSRATGTNLDDMANAAAEVANNLGDVPDKAGTTYAVMKAIAGQGKLGAVEIKDLATQMAKIATVANKFEGGAEANIGVLGVMAQESKLRGGSASATQAATSVSAFARDMVKGTTQKHWTQAGLRVFADEGKTKLRSPEELILEALKYSDKGKGADLTKLATLFPNSMSMRAVSGFANVYNEQGGGLSGLKAVDDEFKRLSAAQLTEEEVTRAFNASMNTTEAKVAQFNNEIQSVATELADALLPAVKDLGPAIVDIAHVLADWVGDLTGSKSQKAIDTAQTIEGEEERNEELLRKTHGVEVGDHGQTVDVYSGEMMGALQGTRRKRASTISELQAQKQKDEEKAAEYEMLDKADAGGLANKGRKLLGMKTYGEEAQALRLRAAEENKELQTLTRQNEQANQILRDIYNAIKSGNARITDPPTAGGGRSPANASSSVESPPE